MVKLKKMYKMLNFAKLLLNKKGNCAKDKINIGKNLTQMEKNLSSFCLVSVEYFILHCNITPRWNLGLSEILSNKLLESQADTLRERSTQIIGKSKPAM